MKPKNFYMKPIKNFSLNSDTDDIFFNQYPMTKVLEYKNWTKKFKEGNQWCLENELNNFNFRSDNFKNTHDDLHILFTGCSNTWGFSLYKEEMWSKILYDKIKNLNDTSGYFNLSVPGTSALSQITNIFKYFNKYGNPNIVFFNMPDPLRFYSYENRLIDSNYNHESLPVLQLLVYQNYLMLEQYCNSNNIKLFSFSWSENTENFMYKLFKKTYYVINKKNITNYLYEYSNKTNDPYAISARDGNHFGTGYNLYWANFMYEKYLNTL
jgi:hypothetical protein